MDDHRQRLGHAVEDEHLVGDEEIQRGGAQLVLGGTRDHGLDVVDELVADEAHRPAGEAGHAGDGDGNEPREHRLDHGKAVADDLLAGRTRMRGDPVGVDHPTLFDDFHPVGGLADHRPRPAAHERVPAQVLAALDRLEEERFALTPQLLVGGQGGFEVREQAAGDRDAIAPAGQRRELFGSACP